jgi:membrane protease YdiL (CAAX protease family)
MFIGERWNQVAALLVSSFAFGALHFAHGFPQGYLGVFLTTLFGLVVGLQLLITRNFVTVWLTHALADAIMFSLIIATR